MPREGHNALLEELEEWATGPDRRSHGTIRHRPRIEQLEMEESLILGLLKETPAQRVLGAKIDGPRYKWNGVYNQYLGGGISVGTLLSRARGERGSEEKMRGEREERERERVG
ncbi:hypothetical protein G5I_01702 [Acromyrmex echinatior]|uniref:Uncharacterized protein n=1 Tax=Acromyrmex echinatior TaxID=103372 RepID=F4W8C1_ACREC|nr:hypothetical protein G5I_01702 [Acromyrmex echinatior]